MAESDPRRPPYAASRPASEYQGLFARATPDQLGFNPGIGDEHVHYEFVGAVKLQSAPADRAVERCEGASDNLYFHACPILAWSIRAVIGDHSFGYRIILLQRSAAAGIKLRQIGPDEHH